MSHKALAHELFHATALARRAGKAALAYYGVNTPVVFKEGGKGPVTAADEAANAILVEGLRAEFPNDAILAEESPTSHDPASRQGKGRLWCIDPIDGTREFVEESGQFVVMVGLAIGGRAALGVVYNPTTDTLWRGVLTQSGPHLAEVECRGVVRPLRVGATTITQEARLVVSNRGPGKTLVHLCHVLGINQLEQLGSVGLKVAWVAEDRADAYVCATDMVHEWDTCGPEAILRAAGGEVTDLFGAELTYNKARTQTLRGMLASNGPLHAKLLQTIANNVEHAPQLRRLHRAK